MALADSSTLNFTVNQDLVLEILEGPDQGRFPTQVQAVREDAVVLAAPQAGRRALQPTPGTPVRLEVNDAPGGVRTVDTKVWESLPAKPPRLTPVIVVQRSEQVQQVQRRSDVRIDIAIPVRFGILASPEDGGDGQGVTMRPTLEASTVDISAGGSQITTEVRLAPQTQIDVHLRLPDVGEPLQLVGEVMRLLKSEQRGGRTLHYLAVRWIGAETKDRDAIVGFIFREQLRRRRRGLL